jgi:serine/threonine protein kinase
MCDFLWQHVVKMMRLVKGSNVLRLIVSDDKLYIVMELIEGAPLADHFNSLKEKKLQFEERRIWNIFLQVKENSMNEVHFVRWMGE